MRKIINGKKYDTETAELLATTDNGYLSSDFKYCSEELYLKKTGEFFLYGVGGPLSKYAEPYGNGWSGASIIIPYTEEEAKVWAVENMSVSGYEKLFGEVEE